MRILKLSIIVLVLSGCTGTDAKFPVSESATTDKETKADTLRGTVLRKDWEKSYESWNAGGSEYFVLDVGDTAVKERSAIEGVILRPSQGISLDVFAEYVDKRVEVSGTFVADTPYVPKNDWEQYPVDPLDADGGPADRGSGFVVTGIEALR